jgi:hypothetical protein
MKDLHAAPPAGRIRHDEGPVVGHIECGRAQEATRLGADLEKPANLIARP